MSDLPQDLKQQLRTAQGSRLEELMAHFGHRLGLGEVRQLLLNPFVTADVLESLATNRRLMSERTLRAAVTGHHKTPPPLALRFVSSLFWRELLEIVVDARVTAAVRRAAETYLVQRLPRLTVGEKVALARRVVGRVAREMAVGAGAEPTLRILDALLTNPRITEQELMPLLTSPRATPRALGRVAETERWGTRYEVRLALCRNPKTPSRNILELLPRLLREDLEAVAEMDEHGWVVRHRARLILDEWPADGYRRRVREIAEAEDVRFELDASARPGDAALCGVPDDAIDSASS